MITNKISVVKNLYKREGLEEGKAGEEPLNENEKKQLQHEKLMILKARKTIKKKRITQQMKDRPDYTDNILLELNCHNLQLYYLRAKKDIDDFLDVFNLEVT